MASAPPPYPGQQSFRDAQRAQRDAARAQRQYWYAMRRPSLIRPFVLIGIGVVALLIQTGHLSAYAFWDWYVRWWPLLLIGLGLLSLLEWFAGRNSPYGTRSSLGGLVGVIILLAILGFAGRHAERSPFGWHFSPEDENWGMHIFGQEHDRDAQFDQDFPAGATLRVENPRGDINIAASSDERIHVSAHNTVYTGSDHEADRQLDRLAPHFHLSGDQATLTTAEVSRGSADLTIQVPKSASIIVHSGRGDVAINGLDGGVNISADQGDIALNKIGGPVIAKMSKGDFSAHLLGASLMLSGRTNDASVAAVKGPVTLDGDFFGDVSLAQIDAPLSFHSSRTTFNVQHLPGDLSLDSGDLHVSRSIAPLRISSKAKNIVLSDVSAGPVVVSNSDGDVALQMVPPVGDIEVRNNTGGIELTLPPNAAFHLEATANNGSVASDFSLTGGDSTEHSLQGSTAIGSPMPRIVLVADHGDIHIQKASGMPPEPPEITEVPKPPKPPKAPHLKVPPAGMPEPTTQ